MSETLSQVENRSKVVDLQPTPLLDEPSLNSAVTAPADAKAGESKPQDLPVYTDLIAAEEAGKGHL